MLKGLICSISLLLMLVVTTHTTCKADLTMLMWPEPRSRNTSHSCTVLRPGFTMGHPGLGKPVFLSAKCFLTNVKTSLKPSFLERHQSTSQALWLRLVFRSAPPTSIPALPLYSFAGAALTVAIRQFRTYSSPHSFCKSRLQVDSTRSSA